MDPQGLQYTFTTVASSSGGALYTKFAVPGATGIEFRATHIEIVNTGTSSPVYVNLATTTATTGDWAITAGSSETVFILRGGFNGISYCSTSLAAPTFRVVALR